MPTKIALGVSRALHDRRKQGGPDDLTGLQVGRLTVIGFAFIRKRLTFWNCRCVCGGSKIVRGTSLRRAKTQSCGCLNREHCLTQINAIRENTLNSIVSRFQSAILRPVDTARRLSDADAERIFSLRGGVF